MNKYISIITILGLFILLFLQSVWLYNSYISTKKEIIIKISDVLENAINKETFFRLGTLPEGTIVQSRPESENGKNIPEFAYMQESLIQLGAPISLDSITF